VNSIPPRYLDFATAFEPGSFRTLALLIGGIFTFATVVIAALHLAGKLKPEKSRELKLRMWSWAAIILIFMVPISAGQVPVMVAMTALSLFCFNEYARAVGLFREKTMYAICAVGILLVNLAAADRWYNFFNALSILTCVVLSGLGIWKDQPKGYTQRVGLAVFGFMFFGYGLAHVSYLANDPNFRGIITFLILSTELNDVFAYVTGHLFGRKKLAPNTSPGKTIAGSIGALILTTALAGCVGPLIFAGTQMANVWLCLPLGLIISTSGQLGDLMLSSVKRDIGVKDLGSVIPGHGGFLDRFDSLVLVAPAAFHFINYFNGIFPQGMN
jgi:phosphatidate cytidylyltransferase